MANITKLLNIAKSFCYKNPCRMLPSNENFYPFYITENTFDSLFIDYKVGYFLHHRRLFGAVDTAQYSIYNGYDIAAYHYKKYNTVDYQTMAIKIKRMPFNSVVIGGEVITGDHEETTNVIANYKDLFRMYSMDPYAVIDLFKEYRNYAINNGGYFLKDYPAYTLYPEEKFEKLYERIINEAAIYLITLEYLQKTKKDDIEDAKDISQLRLNQTIVNILKSVNNGAAERTMKNEVVADIGLNNEEFTMFCLTTANDNPYMPSIEENVTYDEFVSKDFLKYIYTKYKGEFEGQELDAISYSISIIQKEIIKNEEYFKDKYISLVDKQTFKTVKDIMQGKEFPELEKLKNMNFDNLSTMKRYKEITEGRLKIIREKEKIRTEWEEREKRKEKEEREKRSYWGRGKRKW